MRFLQSNPALVKGLQLKAKAQVKVLQINLAAPTEYCPKHRHLRTHYLHNMSFIWPPTHPRACQIQYPQRHAWSFIIEVKNGTDCQHFPWYPLLWQVPMHKHKYNLPLSKPKINIPRPVSDPTSFHLGSRSEIPGSRYTTCYYCIYITILLGIYTTPVVICAVAFNQKSCA